MAGFAFSQVGALVAKQCAMPYYANGLKHQIQKRGDLAHSMARTLQELFCTAQFELRILLT